MRDNLLAVDNSILKSSNCQEYYSSQDPYNISIKLLATASNDELIDSKLKENSNAISILQSQENNRSHSSHIILTLTAPVVLVAIVLQELVTAIDSQSATLTVTALIKSTLNNPKIPQ